MKPTTNSAASPRSPLLDDYPNLFVSRTFSKVYGMAAMRLGCLFSQAANVEFLHKAQSPYSVNTLAALGRARRDSRQGLCRELRRRKCWPRANCFMSAWKSWAFRYYESRRTLSCSRPASAPLRFATNCAARRPGARPQLRNPRLRSRHRRHARPDPASFWPNWSKSGERACTNVGFDMDGVLVDVTESYRETISSTVEHFTGQTISRDRSRIIRIRAVGITTGCCRRRFRRDLWLSTFRTPRLSNILTTCSSTKG